MKLDKETLIKQKFWILLGSFALLWLIATFTLKAAWSEPLEKNKKEYEAANTAIKGVNNPKNKSWWIPWNDFEKKFREYKDTVWRLARAVQETNFYGETTNSKGEPTVMETWPPEFGDNYPLYPTENKEPNDRLRLQFRLERQYENQLKPENLVDVETGYPLFDDPKNPKSRGLLGPVRLEGGITKHFPVPNWKETPTIEECWIAQEDLWVRREMLAIIGHLQTRLAAMKLVTVEDKPADDILRRYVFKNANWELDLKVIQQGNILVLDPERSTIKNVHYSQRTQWLANPINFRGVVFRLHSREKDTWDDLVITGAPVPFGTAKPIGLGKKGQVRQLHVLDLTSLDAAVQQFDWDTSPIREVVTLSVPYQSHRTQTMPLKKRAYAAKGSDTKSDEKPGFQKSRGDKKPGFRNQPGGGRPGGPGGRPGGPGGRPGGPGGMPSGRPGGPGVQGSRPGNMPPGNMPPGNMPPGNMPPGNMPPGNMPPGNMPPGMPNMGGQIPGQAAVPDEDKTSPNGLDRRRYIHVTTECRHLPLAMVVILEPEFLSDLLSEVANSRLRIQMTQVHMHRVRGVTPNRPPPEDDAKAQTTESKESAQNLGEPNLVEVGIYGISSLFERPPPLKPAATNTNSTGGTPSQPPAGTSPTGKPGAEGKPKPPAKTPGPGNKPGPTTKP